MQKLGFYFFILSSTASAIKLSASWDASRQVDVETTNTSLYTGPRIVCVGWKKSGTSSMHAAYDLLGISPVGGAGKCKGPECMKHYKGVEDSYGCCNHGLIKAIKKMYKADEVKFVLTEREPAKWRKSIENWVQRPDKGKQFMGEYGKLMGAKFGTEQFFTNYAEHNKFMRDLFKDEPDRLLVLNLEDGDPILNMKKFCEFVGINSEKHGKCQKDFPHVNENNYFPKELPSLEKAGQDSQATFVSDSWLNIDEGDELYDFDEELATRDWIQWYADQGLSLEPQSIN